jgi:hypothetical protein
MPLSRTQIEVAFAGVLGCLPRATDVLQIEHLGGSVDALADYFLDHFLGGGSERVTREIVATRLREVLEVNQ